MKALFLQTKICEISQIRINLNSLGLVVNKHCQRLKHTTKLGDANKLAFYFKIQFQYSRCGFQQFHWKQSTSVTRHIIDGNVVAVPNQVVGGRVSLLNQGTAVYFTTSFFLNIVDMGSAESQFDDGVLPGDLQRDEHSPQFLTPDMLERTWLDLDPSPDLELP